MLRISLHYFVFSFKKKFGQNTKQFLNFLRVCNGQYFTIWRYKIVMRGGCGKRHTHTIKTGNFKKTSALPSCKIYFIESLPWFCSSSRSMNLLGRGLKPIAASISFSLFLRSSCSCALLATSSCNSSSSLFKGTKMSPPSKQINEQTDQTFLIATSLKVKYPLKDEEILMENKINIR